MERHALLHISFKFLIAFLVVRFDQTKSRATHLKKDPQEGFDSVFQFLSGFLYLCVP